MTTIDPLGNRRCLVDTNVLLRLSRSGDSEPNAFATVAALRSHGFDMFTTVQNVAEYWNVSTRPAEKNGHGLSIQQVSANVAVIVQNYEIISEDREMFDRWLQLLVDYSVSGKQVHDTRIVAHMVRNISFLLTLNIKDFARFADIQLLDPNHMP
jgi:predicted nucleic acid-binding protein